MLYKSFTEMPVWQKAHRLAIEVFKLTTRLPRSEDYGLTSQIRKSSNGAAACIAEGFGRSTKRDKSNIYSIARGSSYETQNHFYTATRQAILKLKSHNGFLTSIMNSFMN